MPWDAEDQERDRIQPTVLEGFAPRRRPGRAPDPNGQVQPGLGEGTKLTGPPARFVPSLNWGADDMKSR